MLIRFFRYHLFWHSKYACPLCTYADYQNITSACDVSSSFIFYLASFYSNLSNGIMTTELRCIYSDFTAHSCIYCVLLDIIGLSMPPVN